MVYNIEYIESADDEAHDEANFEGILKRSEIQAEIVLMFLITWKANRSLTWN
jgi:hypothetical protein